MKYFLFSAAILMWQQSSFAKTKFDFDHSYITTEDSKIWENLGERGFTLNPKAVNHPGGFKCQFIIFKYSSERNQYLEFCSIVDRKAFDKENNDIHGYERERKVYGTGLSLNADYGLETVYRSLKSEFEFKGIEFIHKNYDWEKDSVSRLPGWNFINFNEQELIPGQFLWITEYEKKTKTTGKKQANDKLAIHDNGASHIQGMIFYGDYRTDTRDLAKLLSKPNASPFLLDDGFKILNYTSKANPELKSLFFEKKHIFAAMIIKVKSLKEFNKIAKPEKQDVMIQGKKASWIPLGEWHWDLLFMEDSI